MLKKIPRLLSPELVKALMEMGHGDEIVLADANYPAHSHHSRVIRMDAIGIPDLLSAILELLPLDHYADHQLCLMEVVAGDTTVPSVWRQYEDIVAEHDDDAIFTKQERFNFYSRSQTAYAIVVTGETALYGNIILKKGVL
ncbi:L-fucose mutarotase [Paenibacillus sp. HN-1]|uniref:L-fucose mutarotase n=1 Tax=Paenibacillus TaxID=44249 RepID=UPI001CA9A806|nr:MULTISPECIES: L-fucose mutarotase [Paenibacillus]MBY9077343.1 L-fucose mutarotase [Paenibacillus sp. CGMCC 1.18879]MBY9082728.1 L-fucose mutarotase [Paenibacillus sinensis]